MKGKSQMANKARSGGGITSNKLVHPKVVTGKAWKDRVSVGATSQIGSAMGSKLKSGSLGNSYSGENSALPLMKGRVPHPAPGLGNAVALNVGKGGVGTGRTIYHCGTQMKTPAPTPMSGGKDILSSYGPDFRSKGSKR
jgi:hypothetical protein